MTRPTVSDLMARVEQLEADLAALRAAFEAVPPVSLHRDVGPPAPLSVPLDVPALAAKASAAYACYDEVEDTWGPQTYL